MLQGFSLTTQCRDRFGRPPALDDEKKKAVFLRVNEGKSISAIAREFNTTRQTILRVKAAAGK